jgi:hypothetical protein
MALDNIIWFVVAVAIAIVGLMLWFGRRDGIVRPEATEATLAEKLQRLDAYVPPPMNNPRIEPPAVDVAANDRATAREAPEVTPPALPARK